MKKIFLFVISALILFVIINTIFTNSSTPSINNLFNNTSSEKPKIQISYFVDDFGELKQEYSSIFTSLKDIDDFIFEEASSKELANLKIEKKASFVTESKNQDFNEITRLLPVTHFYNIFSTFDKTKNYEIYCSNYCSDIKLLVNSNLIKGNINELTSETEVISKLKNNENAITFLQPNDLNMNYKLLTINGSYYLDNIDKNYFSFYPEVSLNEADTNLKTKIEDQIQNIKSTGQIQFKQNDLLTVNMTGVTAITRGLLSKTRKSGNDAYPSTQIANFLSGANLTHVSNEISFASNCSISDTRFCSDEDITLATLKASGVDIIELTGNHNNDWGFNADTQTLNKYKELGYSYFGGGLTSTEAEQILYKELNGTKLAFLGYNYYDTVHPSSALASATNPGANSFSFEKISRDIKLAHGNGAFAIVTVQYQECYSYPDGYVIFPICYQPVSGQKTDFRKIIELGADMVIGTQAHQPQTYEIYNGKPIFYGLGNLYFDQVDWPGTEHGIVLTNYYNKNKLIQTKLTTTNYKSDMQTYITTGVESEKLLKLLKDARSAL